MTAQELIDYKRYGLVVLTTAVFAVLLTAPAGAILVNSFGKQLLSYDGDKKALYKLSKSDYAMKFGDDHPAEWDLPSDEEGEIEMADQ